MDWEEHKEVFINFWVKCMLPIAGFAVVFYLIGRWLGPYLPKHTGQLVMAIVTLISSLALPLSLWFTKLERDEKRAAEEAEHKAKLDEYNKENACPH